MEETKILQEKLVICYTPLFFSIVSCILSNVMSTTDFHLHSVSHNRLKVRRYNYVGFILITWYSTRLDIHLSGCPLGALNYIICKC